MPTPNQHIIATELFRHVNMVYDTLDASRYIADQKAPDTGDVLNDFIEAKATIISYCTAGKNTALRIRSFVEDALGIVKAQEAINAVYGSGSASDLRDMLISMYGMCNTILANVDSAIDWESLLPLKTYIDSNLPPWESPRRAWAL